MLCYRGARSEEPPKQLTLFQYQEIISQARETCNLIVRELPRWSRESFQALYPGKDLPHDYEKTIPARFGAFLSQELSEPLFSWENDRQLKSHIAVMRFNAKVTEFLSSIPRPAEVE